MNERSELWDEGQQVWERLAQWYRGIAAPSPDLGEEALQALTSVGELRRVLDRVEFEAIRASRRQGKSWAEIATRLGITRQSAWERWQDIDQPERPQPAQETEPSIVAPLRAAERRHRATVVVPNVIGLAADRARDRLRDVRLVAVGPDPDGPPMSSLRGVVTDQSPESGAMAAPGSSVRLWIDRQGGSGVREPRRPKPDPKTGRKMLDEVTDEAVG